MSFQDILTEIRSKASSKREKGTIFEELMLRFLRVYPLYKYEFSEIWLWNDFPYKASISNTDVGIDLVAYDINNNFWAIQCKCYAETHSIQKSDIDSFLSTSSRTFDINNNKVEFANRLIITTTNKWSSNAENALNNQIPQVSFLKLHDIETAPIDWSKLWNGESGENVIRKKKEIRDHQRTAIDYAHAHFSEHNRGKLIMACGTGKTYTSLKIAENETNNSGVILFLVPSIALLGQTLREWMIESEKQISAICICSDASVTKKKRSDGGVIIDEKLPLPASTNVDNIVKQFFNIQAKKTEGLIVVFSTYQSIDVTEKAQKKINSIKSDACVFDLIICDEAHRTTGVLSDENESYFTKVHDDKNILAKKRMYMTATPRIYTETSKEKAQDKDMILCSMDDESLYGKEFYKIGFGEAVSKDLLSDYKVLVFTLNEDQIPKILQDAIADGNSEIKTDDALKLLGCIYALSKRMLINEKLVKDVDPNLMHKAVAFCSTIETSKAIKKLFDSFKDTYYKSLKSKDRKKMVDIDVEHVDGSMLATTRYDKLSWLNGCNTDGNCCRMLSNVRCLSEGVDVPSLDAVIFFSAKNSQIDVVQSVGRVMRKSQGKNYGYIIIPVLISSGVDPADALKDNSKYAVIWDVLNALRAHDERFEAMINSINFNKDSNNKILIGGFSDDRDNDDDYVNSEQDGSIKNNQLSLTFEKLKKFESSLHIKLVEKVGNKQYWEQWATDVADIAKEHIKRIKELIQKDHKQLFSKFLDGLRKNINNGITEDNVIEMLAQHMITRPIFDALFKDYSFAQNNPISQSMQSILDRLNEHNFDERTETLNKFYDSVKQRVEVINTSEGRQKIIVELYDKFFKTAFSKTVERLGIVYTPIEVVDFINQSVNDVLQEEFGRSLSDKNVHILDPFTGTGTFITRMIQSGLIKKEDLPRKYKEELHANEIVLLAYYIASVNIENAFHDAMELNKFETFNGICLTDTFQLTETGDFNKLFTEELANNSERVVEQQKVSIKVIIGNPPYSARQASANDNAKNIKYPMLDDRIAKTYVAESNSINKNSLYDSYIRALRWSSDRICEKSGGVIGFITNGGWLDGNSSAGVRKCFEKDFSKIYIFNLRGGARKSGDIPKKEGVNIFKIKAAVTIIILVKNPNKKTDKATIYYRDIGDYLSRKEKLELIKEYSSIQSPKMNLCTIEPNKNGDWINHRSEVFKSFYALGNKKNDLNTVFLPKYSCGISTSRDSWCYNFSKHELEENIKKSIDYYNEQCEMIENIKDIVYDSTKFSWDQRQKDDVLKKKKYEFAKESVVISIYRPFIKEYLYFNRVLNNRVYQMPKLFPTPHHKNKLICINGIGGSNGFMPLIVDYIPDLHILDSAAQCFPLYHYEETAAKVDLFTAKSNDGYVRKDAITDFILNECHKQYDDNIAKEDIFYYVYGFLHSKDYSSRFKNDLKKVLARIPLVKLKDDFWSFSKAGRSLAELHLNYENIPHHPDVVVNGVENENFCVSKMSFVNKNDKSNIKYNSYITISNIPLQAYEYVINGKSAIEWIIDRYQTRTHKETLIKNDPNLWCKEQENPRYIFELLLSIISLSVKTVDIINSLPKENFV